MATYTELVSKVKDWSNRDDISDAVIADFLDYTAKRIYNRLRIPPFEHIEEITIPEDDTRALTVPSDMIEVIMLRTLNTDGTTKQVFSDKQDARSFAQRTANNGHNNNLIYNLSYEYTRVGGEYRFYPALGAGERLELYYYRELPALNSNCENWLRDESEEILLYGALARLWKYVGSPEEEQRWMAQFEETLKAISQEELMRETRGGSTTQTIITNGLI